MTHASSDCSPGRGSARIVHAARRRLSTGICIFGSSLILDGLSEVRLRAGILASLTYSAASSVEDATYNAARLVWSDERAKNFEGVDFAEGQAEHAEKGMLAR